MAKTEIKIKTKLIIKKWQKHKIAKGSIKVKLKIYTFNSKYYKYNSFEKYKITLDRPIFNQIDQH